MGAWVPAAVVLLGLIAGVGLVPGSWGSLTPEARVEGGGGGTIMALAKGASCDGGSPPVKIITYNLLWGGEGDHAGRLTGIQEWLREQGADVVALQECNGWHKLPGVAVECGYEHFELLECKTGYHVGIMSKTPLTNVRGSVGAPFHHGLLEAEARGIRFLVTHLSPKSAARRLEEAGAIRTRCVELAAEGVPAVVVGDLNTLSPLDEAAHQGGGLAEVLSRDETGRLQQKFLVGEGASQGPPELDYATMRTLLSTPLSDMAAPQGALLPPPGYTTVPTELADSDPMHAAPMRIDFVLASPLLAAASPARAVAGPATRALSDHYPVVCHLCLAEEGGGGRQEL